MAIYAMKTQISQTVKTNQDYIKDYVFTKCQTQGSLRLDL